MAIAATHLTSSFSDTDATSYNTASISPSGNALVLAAVQSTRALGAEPTVPSLTGNGLTWVQISTSIFYDTTGTTAKLSLFRAMGASPSAGAVTIAFGGVTQTSCTWSIAEFTGVDTTGTNGSGAVVQSAQDSPGPLDSTLTVTLAAFGSADNATYGAFAMNDADVLTQGASFTLFGQAQSGAPAMSIGSEYQLANDTTVDISGSLGGSRVAGIAIEVKAAAGGGGGGTTHPGWASSRGGWW